MQKQARHYDLQRTTTHSKDVPKLRGIHLLIRSSKLGSTGLSKSSDLLDSLHVHIEEDSLDTYGKHNP